jgi:hypothetical protein
VVLVTVVLLAEPLLPPLRIATSNRINTAPPTTQTQGAVHHSVRSVVVVFTVVLEVEVDVGLSCAHVSNTRMLQSNIAAKYLDAAIVVFSFIVSFLIDEKDLHATYFKNCAN